MLADRMVLLDHLTRGRVMFGVGPGALPSDAFMMGIDVARQRDMMEEAFEAILELLAGEKPVNRETDWFTLKDARLQLRPYSDPRFEIAVAAQVSPSGPRLAGPLRRVAAVDRRHQPRAASTCSARTGPSWRSGPPSSAPRSTAASGASSARCTSPTPRSRPTRTCGSACPQWVDYFQRVAALPLGAGHRRRRARWPTP